MGAGEEGWESGPALPPEGEGPSLPLQDRESLSVQGLPSWRAGPRCRGQPIPPTPTCRLSLPTLKGHGPPTGEGADREAVALSCGPHEPPVWVELGGQHVHPGVGGTGIFKSLVAQVSTFSSYKSKEEKKERERKEEEQERKKDSPANGSPWDRESEVAPADSRRALGWPIHSLLRLTF